MSNPKKRSKKSEAKAKTTAPAPVKTTTESVGLETAAAPRVAKDQAVSNPVETPDRNTAGLSPLMLGSLLLSLATLLGIIMFSWSFSGKLQQKASGEQMDKLTAQVSRLSGMLEESLKHNQEALDASLKASRLDQRAWVGVRSIQMLPMEAGKPLNMEIKFSNSGKTFALDVRHTGILRLSDKPLSDITPEDRASLDKQPKQVPTLVTLAPSGESLIPCASLAPITEEMIAAINTGKVHVYLVGEISYTDVFKQWHTTRFFQHYVPAEQKFLAEQSHNDAD